MLEPNLRRSLVIPMWQESARVDRCVEMIAGSALNGPDTEILLVDDGSGDDTFERAGAAVARTGLNARVLRIPVNAGKGAAVRHGVMASGGRTVGFVDADLSTEPVDVIRVFEVAENGADVAVASRTHAASFIGVRQPSLRRMSGVGFNQALRLLGLTSLRDTQCGLKAFSAPVARELFEPLRTHGFAFDVEVLARARRHGLKVVEVPVTWRHVESSRVAPLKDGFAMLRDAVRIRAAIGPRS